MHGKNQKLNIEGMKLYMEELEQDDSLLTFTKSRYIRLLKV